MLLLTQTWHINEQSSSPRNLQEEEECNNDMPSNDTTVEQLQVQTTVEELEGEEAFSDEPSNNNDMQKTSQKW